MKIKINRIFLALCIFTLLSLQSIALAALSPFTVGRIEFRGLQRISRQTVQTYLPVKAGERLTADKTGDILRALYKTQFFSNINLAQENDTLVINVVERPVISSITIKGNKSIPKKPFNEMIKSTGLLKGRIFNRGILEQVKLVLINQYRMQSLYNAQVHTHVQHLPRNRVSVKLHIREGKTTKIRQIHIIGNRAFSDRKLISHMELSTTHFWSWITHGDNYSKVGLEKGIEKLRSFYLNRGYLEFHVESYDAKLDTQKHFAEVFIHIHEGPIYKLGAVKLTGDMKNYAHSIRRLVTVKPGQLFSRRELIKVQRNIVHYFAGKGYAFADVNILTHTNHKTGRVDIELHVLPGRYVYVRQINFHGNTKTANYVLRREMRQIEGSVFSLAKVEESKRRLANLGYLENIQLHVKPVPDKPDEVDLDYTVKEMSSAKATLQVGYSDTEGVLYGASVNQRNFMGTGKTVNLSFDRSAYRRAFNFYYNNPYYTVGGISRGFNLYIQRTTPGRTNISAYRSNIYGAAVTYGIPISDYSRFTFSLGYERIDLNVGTKASAEVKKFIDERGRNFDQFRLSSAWGYSNYDRAVFPTHGFGNGISAEVGLPLGSRSLDYYLLNYHATWYQPISRAFIFKAGLHLGYGRGYGDTGTDLPFFKNYYAGGIGSVRGYEGNSLGPLDSNGDALGGNLLTTGTVAIILPPYFGSKVRTSVFVDAGAVDKDKFGDLHYSAGIMIKWHTPMAPLQFSFAESLNRKPGDHRRFFQFNLGG